MALKTRFAPSPTGYLHIGGLRTALYDYLLAQKEQGTFLLRIEDTDQAREVEGATEKMIKILSDLGIAPDEGPTLEDGKLHSVGDNGPYVQSERLEIYKTHIQQLIENKKAYYCFCSKERLEDVRKQQEIAKLQPKYDRHCCNLTDDEVKAKLEAGESHVVRLRIPDGETTIQDAVRGAITISNSEVDDQVIQKSDGFPTYHLAVVVDDHLMEVTHVIRGEEWISSFPKHVILYESFGWDLPVFAHLPLILNPDRSKLSKRQGDVAVEDYLAKGYLPEALLNFVALCGFNPKGDQEIYTLQELIEGFDLSKINKSGAIFDRDKLDWMNGQYIKALSAEELASKVRPFITKEIDNALLTKVCEIEKERLATLTELDERLSMYLDNPDYDPSILVWKKADKDDAITQLTDIITVLETLADEKWKESTLIEEAVKGYISTSGKQNGNVLWPLRVALSGAERSPSPFELLWVFQKEESLARIQKALTNLAS
jgi:nondiscriminating glutamyl-tRNA synthetase